MIETACSHHFLSLTDFGHTHTRCARLPGEAARLGEPGEPGVEGVIGGTPPVAAGRECHGADFGAVRAGVALELLRGEAAQEDAQGFVDGFRRDGIPEGVARERPQVFRRFAILQ